MTATKKGREKGGIKNRDPNKYLGAKKIGSALRHANLLLRARQMGVHKSCTPKRVGVQDLARQLIWNVPPGTPNGLECPLVYS
jgi:hypothetical protein